MAQEFVRSVPSQYIDNPWFDSLQARYAGEKANVTKHTCPVVDPYRPLLALPQKADSFKFKLACIGGESEWKIISIKAGAGYFGRNELYQINL